MSEGLGLGAFGQGDQSDMLCFHRCVKSELLIIILFPTEQ